MNSPKFFTNWLHRAHSDCVVAWAKNIKSLFLVYVASTMPRGLKKMFKNWVISFRSEQIQKRESSSKIWKLNTPRINFFLCNIKRNTQNILSLSASLSLSRVCWDYTLYNVHSSLLYTNLTLVGSFHNTRRRQSRERKMRRVKTRNEEQPELSHTGKNFIPPILIQRFIRWLSQKEK